MGSSSRINRLNDEFSLMKILASESDLFQIKGVRGNPPEAYQIIFNGKSLMLQGDQVVETDHHEVTILMGVDWPQSQPIFLWSTPIFHPNIKAPNVCPLGQPYSAMTHLDQMVETLWNMLTFQRYNIKSPLDKQAAKWAAEHKERFPVDKRVLRNKTIDIRIYS